MSSPAGQAQETVALSGGRSMRAALRHPSGAPPRGGWPGVLVVHELFGLTPEIVAVGDRFADRGWVAAVPDLFSSGVRVGCLVRALREVTGGRAAGMTDDLRAVLDWLGEQPDVDASRTAVIGLCMGGAFALLLGSLGPEGLRAVSDNYGAPPAADLDLTRCPPVLLNYGGRDPALGKQGPKIAARLRDAGVEVDEKTYPNAAHSFLTPDHKLFGIVPVPLTSYVDDAARDGWERIFTFLERHTAPAS